MKTTTGTINHWFHGFTFKGRALSVFLEVAYTATPYDSGCTSGPPEGCYPPEGGDVEDCTFELLAVKDEDGENWPEATLAEDGPPLLAAVVKWWLAGETDTLAEAIALDVAEQSYYDEPDFYPD